MRWPLACCAAVVGLALSAVPALPAWMVPPSPYRAKDFTLVKRDGWYHCFYIRSDPSVPPDSTERDLGHAMSRDMYNWLQLPPVLPRRADKWDNWRIWAPSIVEVEGVYYMFYTGVTEQYGSFAFHQRTGLATSTDLMIWNRLDEPVFSCGQVRWSLCDPMQYGGGEFRDPFVMQNPAGGWLMLYTAFASSMPGTAVAGVASSSGDLTQWVNREPLWVSHTSYSGSAIVESPHMFFHNGLWYLLFTGNGLQPLRLATGTSPTGDASTWTFRGTLNAMLGTDTRFWFASEYFVDGTHEYLCFADFDRVDLREIVWSPGWQFSLVQPDLMHVQSMSWSAASATPGETVQLTIEAVNTLNKTVTLEAVEVDPGGAEEIIPTASIGLPSSVTLTGATTTVSWVVQGWPDTEGPDGNAEIVVRLADHTAATTPLTVTRVAWTWDPGNGHPPMRPELHPFQRDPTGFRTLERSPLGEIALLVDLPEPTAARLDVFDLAGRRVRNLADRTFPAGATVVPWDGREEGGARVRPGVYFARLTTATSQRTARVLVRD